LSLVVGGRTYAGTLGVLHKNVLASQVRFLGWLPQTELLPVCGFDVGYSGHLDLKGMKVYRSPLKLYEYMAMGKPVVASAVEDARALVREQKTGSCSPWRSGLKQALVRAYKLESS